MANGFDKFGFLGMLITKYADCVYSVIMRLLIKIVDDAYANYDTSKDQLVLRLADMLPDLDFGEAAQFVDDSWLIR